MFVNISLGATPVVARNTRLKWRGLKPTTSATLSKFSTIARSRSLLQQNKPDIGATIARKWFDQEGVDIVVDVITSSVALAVQSIARDRNKIAIFSGAGAGQLAGESCVRNTFVWTWDTYALLNAASRAFMRENRRDWYLIEVDYALGKALDQSLRDALERSGGKVVGVSRHPLRTPDFSSFLLKAQSSGASVIALLNGGRRCGQQRQAGE